MQKCSVSQIWRKLYVDLVVYMIMSFEAHLTVLKRSSKRGLSSSPPVAIHGQMQSLKMHGKQIADVVVQSNVQYLSLRNRGKVLSYFTAYLSIPGLFMQQVLALFTSSAPWVFYV